MLIILNSLNSSISLQNAYADKETPVFSKVKTVIAAEH